VARVVVMGAGVVGLTTAMLLSRDGHEVTVVERDAAEPDGSPEALWSEWERRGVNQFRLLHYFQPEFRVQLERELPAVVDALDAAGAIRHNVVALVPEQLSGGLRDGDEQYEALTARRPVMEAVLARCAESMPGVEIRRGVGLEGVVTGTPVTPGTPGTPHVIGVRSTSGEEFPADLVVDALGRRSPLASWLQAAGARPAVEEREDCGFVYYARYFRSADGTVPAMIAPLLQDYGTVSILTLPADNGTWGVGLIVSAKDKAARALKDPATWQRTLAAFPLAAHWTDGEPLEDGVAVMAGVEDRHRDYCPEGEPVATGVVSVGDAWACTNPSAGRGMSVGLVHAQQLRVVVRDTLADPVAFGLAFDERTEAVVAPFYRNQVAADRARIGEMTAIRDGLQPPRANSIMARFMAAAGYDPDVFRGLLETILCMALPQEVLERPGMRDKIEQYRDAEAPPTPGPDREELLRLLAA
jgi:2-polyprenyl-6-methoxyphenol hydroxylase-like FAD-dependent oxidoreductase